jgi:hypothetical protein
MAQPQACSALGGKNCGFIEDILTKSFGTSWERFTLSGIIPGTMFANAIFRWTDPATWPWIFYVWLAMILAGWSVSLWRWLKRKRAAGWPIAYGRIESAEVTKASFSLTANRGRYVAQLGYAYSIAGNVYSGVYKREFSIEPAAEDFVRDLKGKAIAVRYSPAQPSQSIVLEPDIEAVLQNRPPSDDRESVTSMAMPEWLRPFIRVFVWLSAIGLVISLWVHIGALMGRTVSPAFWVLHVGIFVVWFPSVLVAQRLVGSTRRQDFWKVVLKGAPGWMRYMVYAFLVYAFVNFMIFMAQAGGRHDTPSAVEWRGFSGHWMAFYSAAFAILYSAANMMDSSPRCTNGHPASPSELYCTQCGQPVVRTR